MKLTQRYGSNIGIYFAEDDTPLEWASFGAFVSRNNGSFENLLSKVNEVAVERIIHESYISYGHQSIGDLVDIKLFLEGIPIWLAFELEGFSRFRGQESSTRYIDFSNLPLNPYYSHLQDWYDERISEYTKASKIVSDNIFEHAGNIHNSDVSISTHLRAIKARTFDITRSLIPSIAATNMVWYGNIREMREQLQYLLDQKTPFIQEIIDALDAQYPQTKPEKAPRYRRPWMSIATSPTDRYILEAPIDFGSLRDFRRHRVGHHRINYRSSQQFHSWYMEMFRAHGLQTIFDPFGQHAVDIGVPHPPLLGHLIDWVYICDPVQAQYISALRTKMTVHPTVRFRILDDWRSSPELRDVMTTTEDVGAFGYVVIRGNDTITFQGKDISE